jgi:hypothetical protein
MVVISEVIVMGIVVEEATEGTFAIVITAVTVVTNSDALSDLNCSSGFWGCNGSIGSCEYSGISGY